MLLIHSIRHGRGLFDGPVRGLDSYGADATVLSTRWRDIDAVRPSFFRAARQDVLGRDSWFVGYFHYPVKTSDGLSSDHLGHLLRHITSDEHMTNGPVGFCNAKRTKKNPLILINSIFLNISVHAQHFFKLHSTFLSSYLDHVNFFKQLWPSTF